MSSQKISALATKTALLAADYFPIVDSSDTSNKKTTILSLQRSLYQGTLVYVVTKSDLPAAVAGVISLLDDVTYFFTAVVDLTGDRLEGGQNTTLIGGSSENCGILSTGLSASTALITSNWSLPIRNIKIEHATGVNLDATGNANQAIDWFGVNFVNCTTSSGTIKAYTNFIMADSALLNSAGFIFDGSTGTVGFAGCLFDLASGSTGVTIPSTATITRRFRIVYSSFVVGAGETGINVSTSASIPVEGYILSWVNFSGAGTYTTGVLSTDNKALFSECRGVANTASVGSAWMINNATATTIASTVTYYKILGTTTAGSENQRFNHTNNRLTYVGALSGAFKVTAVLSASSGNNQLLIFRIAKNGTTIAESESQVTTSGSGRSENIKSICVTGLVTNDYIEIFVQNSTATNNVTVSELNFIVEPLI